MCFIIKRKINTRIYESFNSFYRLRWPYIIKKDRKSLRIVHSLELLNKVTIAHLGLFPATEELAIHFVGRVCNRILDLYIRYNKQILECLQDLTIFQTSFGALRLVTLPMG